MADDGSCCSLGRAELLLLLLLLLLLEVEFSSFFLSFLLTFAVALEELDVFACFFVSLYALFELN